MTNVLWSFICGRKTVRHKWRCYGRATNAVERDRFIKGLHRDIPGWQVGFYQKSHPNHGVSPYEDFDRPANCDYMEIVQ